MVRRDAPFIGGVFNLELPILSIGQPVQGSHVVGLFKGDVPQICCARIHIHLAGPRDVETEHQAVAEASQKFRDTIVGDAFRPLQKSVFRHHGAFDNNLKGVMDGAAWAADFERHPNVARFRRIHHNGRVAKEGL